VLLYSHMLLRDLPEGDSRTEDLETIVAETTRCKNIVTDLLNFARENQVNAEPVDLNALLEGILEIAEKGTAQGVALVRHFAPDLPPVLADPDQLTQAFRNILENSYEAMPGGGTVEVTTSLVNEDSVRVEISDTGPGIPPEVLAHIFEPFFTTKPMGQGTGLGLALADGIVKLHRGQIRASNRLGGGATFTITIPLQGPAEAPAGGLIG
jgi:two-component system NtrC family sensor kinase